MNRQSLGKRGEELAAKFLKKLKYRILERNFNTRWGELDIVAKDQKAGEIVFVEVRTRSSTGFMHPGESVYYTKQNRLRKAAHIWLSENFNTEPPPCRFDIVSVVIAKDAEPVIEHFPEAFT